AQAPGVPARPLRLGRPSGGKPPLRQPGSGGDRGAGGKLCGRRRAGLPGGGLRESDPGRLGCRRGRRRRAQGARAGARSGPAGARAPAEVRMSAPISIPMADPAGEYRLLKDEIDAAVGRVLASGRYVLGPEGEALERELAAYLGVRHALGCNSGTDALHLPLVAAGVGPGDEVIVPAFTFFATAEAVSHTGATPVFADVDPQTFNLSAASLSAKISSRTRAVIAVHLFGQCAELDRIAELCRSRGLLLIEDCAQALGAEYLGKRAGG